MSAALAAVEGVGRVVVVGRTASTSTDLVAAVTTGHWPDRSVLVADHQTAGRGRNGRTWTTPPGSSLTFSVLFRPHVPVEGFGWVGLMAGLAVVHAVAEAGVRAVLKWPNDVLVAPPGASGLPGWGELRKVAGVLGEVVAMRDGPAAVVGIGVNVDQRDADLPVPWASSLALAGAQVDRAELLVAVVRHLVDLDGRWRAADGDAQACGVAAQCAAACVTLGSRVRVDLPGGEVLVGTAVGLGATGALEVVDGRGRLRTVVAGDVHHVRAAGGPGTLPGPVI